MFVVAFPKEVELGEKRSALLPQNIRAYLKLGAKICVEKGIAEQIGIPDSEFANAGAEVRSDRESLLRDANLVLSVRALPQEELALVGGKTVVSFLDPFQNREYTASLLANSISSISMEMIPRTTRCQKMDALSSQASLAGYVMVAKAMSSLKAIFPMMMTAAGTIKPAKVFVIGAGVAGLQAIATAKRLGASVTAYDTRPEVAEQVRSLGAQFLDIDLGQTGQTSQGYAKALTAAQLKVQREAQAKCIANSDVVITTAQLFGRKPPTLIDKKTLSLMKPGSVVVDMAAENGGNVEGSVVGKTVNVEGVKLIGTGNWAAEVALNASQMYANNLLNLVSEFWNVESGFVIDTDDEIQSVALLTHEGKLVSRLVKEHFSLAPVNQFKESA